MELDATDWPLVRIIQRDRWTPDQLRAVFRLLDDLLARERAFAVAHDARRAGPPGDLARRLEADWLHTHGPLLGRWCRGWAVCRADPDRPAIAASPAGGGELPTEVRAFTDWEAAQRWAAQRAVGD